MSSVASRQQAAAATARSFHIASRQVTTYGNAKAIRRAVLARLATTERALLWRWCIGITAVYAALAALLAIVVLVTHAFSP
jgi:hypothetical protein